MTTAGRVQDPFSPPSFFLNSESSRFRSCLPYPLSVCTNKSRHCSEPQFPHVLVACVFSTFLGPGSLGADSSQCVTCQVPRQCPLAPSCPCPHLSWWAAGLQLVLWVWVLLTPSCLVPH
jgi:hypothetical protein